MEKCVFCEREFERHVARVYHQNRCANNPDKKNQWNTGLSKETDDRIKKYSESQSETKKSESWKKDNIIWNKGLSKGIDNRVQKCSDSQSQTRNSEEWKRESHNRIYKKYNGKHFTQTEEYNENRKKIYKEKYGVENPLQRPEIFEKMKRHRYLHHEYVLPSGKSIWLQGYEPYAIEKLLFKFNLNENDVRTLCDEMPKIFYILNGKEKKYFPDLFVESWNKIIEVKSEYTIKCNREKNLLKHQASIRAGFYHEIWICFPKKDDYFIIDDLEKYYSMI
jgi:hypothetical protein